MQIDLQRNAPIKFVMQQKFMDLISIKLHISSYNVLQYINLLLLIKIFAITFIPYHICCVCTLKERMEIGAVHVNLYNHSFYTLTHKIHYINTFRKCI